MGSKHGAACKVLKRNKLENAKKNAAEAKLREKESLEKLVLEWSGDVAAPQDEEAHERVLEDLQPHSNLKELLVFASWVPDFLF
ncbi:hypothetical protein CK203_065895 [Vitis vinifera]|uniref:R13L1/DRL21-like LRR repeat region domain-containing protein n=1 Tax=Vitis vinifera TaxID=29760 RepID=A0A438G3X5_VITVI|nr:hypothetical protein CK203_065895 [Vitis vinifera]